MNTVPNFSSIKLFASILEPKNLVFDNKKTSDWLSKYNYSRISNDLESNVDRSSSDEVALARAAGEAFIGGIAGKLLKGHITLYNNLGHQVFESLLGSVTCKLIPLDSDTEDSFDDDFLLVKLLNSGVFEISYIPHKSGLYKLHVYYMNEHIENSPFEVKIKHGQAYGPNCYIEVLDFDMNVEYNGIIIHAMDSENNAVEVGGDEFSVISLGGVRIVSYTDLSNGKYLVTYKIISLYQDAQCQIEVKLKGLELKNSPISLRHVPPVINTSIVKPTSELTTRLLQLKDCFSVKKKMGAEYENLENMTKETLDECKLAYHALNKRIVYSLPIMLNLEECGNKEEMQKDIMNEYINKHKELSERVDKIESDKKKLAELEKEVIETLQDKFTQLKKINRQYKYVHSKIQTEINRETMQKRTGLVKNECTDLNSDDDYCENIEDLGCVPGIYISQGEKKNTFKICETKPDNPSTPAYWLSEGRFLNKNS